MALRHVLIGTRAAIQAAMRTKATFLKHSYLHAGYPRARDPNVPTFPVLRFPRILSSPSYSRFSAMYLSLRYLCSVILYRFRAGSSGLPAPHAIRILMT
jgi:hypothetical protein